MFKNFLLIIFVWIASWLFYEFIRHELKEPAPDYTYIDFSSLLAKDIEANGVKFKISKEFHSTYIVNSSSFTLHISPSEHLPFKKLGTGSSNSLRILVKAVNDEERMRSVYTLAKATDEKKESENRPYFVGYSGDFKMFNSDHSSPFTYYLKEDSNGYPIVITDPGDWSHGYRVYRRLNSNIEIDYVFTKAIDLSSWDLLDNYILQILDSLQQPYNKKIMAGTREQRASHI
ncbi:hypothetical protein ORJ04_21995 [Rheinheimera baltica]|uniref:Uncharacterized protein n=1 Tax=Rheinheimera baltica TaxID=67576 RepID=A0ABT9I5E4_9GAMM|nr:hypothetical protein [Rheinheimera baltica]MDP5138623.1 hypothetical protein [Rheinheimera baltica]